MFKQPLSRLNKVGKTLNKRLQKLNLATTLDLIFYYPSRYEDLSQITKIADLRPNQQTTIRGRINMIDNRRSWQKKMSLTEAIISDQTDSIKVVWFNRNTF